VLTPFSSTQHLPREARDTLFLLSVITWVLLPHIDHLPLWCAALAAGVLLWRGRLAWLNHSLPSRWWLLGLLGITIGATYLTHRTLLGREAGVTLIVVLLALKTLELRAKRDAFVVFFLGFFTMLTNFFYSQSLLTAATMLIALLGLLTALVLAHMPVGKPPLAQAAKTAFGMALLGAPIMAVLFVLFPRIAPLWGLPGDAASARTGLSATMQVGKMAQLALDEGIAMRLRFADPVPPASDLYFRGPVLGGFDGREWRPLAASSLPLRPGRLPPGLETTGTPVRYQVTLEPHQQPWLLVLDATRDAPVLPGAVGLVAAATTADLQWLADHNITELTRYNAQSYTQFSYGPLTRDVRDTTLSDTISLPPGFNPRTLQWAAALRRDPQLAQADALTLTRTVLNHLRTGGYTYTLEPGVYGTHTADEFWFDRKEGFCEHIASSFVIVMRALDVPARIVTGYQGGELNAVDGFWVVRNSDAHAWAEVWQAGRGWVRVDPTGAVSPGRIGNLARLAAPRGAIATVFGQMSPDLAAKLRATWEAVNNGWNQWVLNYSQKNQLNLLKNIGFTTPSWEDLGYLLAGLVVLASSLGAAWTVWDRRQRDPWLRLLQQVRTRLNTLGLELPLQSAPRQMATQAQQHFGQAAQPLKTWLLRLERLRYGTAATNDSLRQLQRDLNTLSWPQRPSP
jgi:protein-glutamine gamma-glutamyltransferase